MGGPKVIVITGPTATGKTALGAALARMADGEVVSADSMQIYKHMDVGTAKPSESEKLGVAHYMLDVVLPWEGYSVARYVADAAQCVDDILRRGKLPVIVGGTGLYIDSLVSGREFPARGDAGLRRELEEEYEVHGGAAMLRRLGGFDAASAGRLHENDKKRIVRAIEVFLKTGKTVSEHDLESRLLPPRYDAVKFALTFTDRSGLYSRIDLRVDGMVAGGLEGEVRGLLDMGVRRDHTAMQAIGYKEMSGFIHGECDLGSAVEKIKRESRRYAKRQLTWLRRDGGVRWIARDEEPNVEAAARSILHYCEVFL